MPAIINNNQRDPLDKNAPASRTTPSPSSRTKKKRRRRRRRRRRQDDGEKDPYGTRRTKLDDLDPKP